MKAIGRHIILEMWGCRNLDSVEIPSRFHSNWMDNSKARYHLAWQPQYDLERLIDSAFEYQRVSDDARKVWYPG